MSPSSLTSDLRSPNSPQTGEVLVRVEGVSKKFCRSLKKSLWYGVQDVARELVPFGKNGGTQKSEIRDQKSEIGSRKSGLTSDLRSPTSDSSLRDGEFWANKDISLELRRGECVGLIGRNGAGKTTLLKMLNGLIKPDTGRIEMRGSVGAMIALGAGFNPILTGRENIYVAGSLRGMSKQEIDERMDEIVDFAEIRDFMDMPVQSYSSGMQVRLGFAVTAALSPDIMLIDEVLAVGDVAFRAKCYRRIDQLRRTAAIVLVSHNMEQIGNACDRVIVMDRGRVAIDGAVDKGVEVYDRLNESASGGDEKAMRRVSAPVEAAELVLPSSIPQGRALSAALDLRLSAPIFQMSLRIKILSPEGSTVAEISADNVAVALSVGAHRVMIGSDKLFLRPGAYVVGLSVNVLGVLEPSVLHWRAYKLVIEGPRTSRGTHWQLPAQISLTKVSAAPVSLSR